MGIPAGQLEMATSASVAKNRGWATFKRTTLKIGQINNAPTEKLITLSTEQQQAEAETRRSLSAYERDRQFTANCWQVDLTS